MFIVMWNLPGGLPETQPMVVEEFGEAKELVKDELNERISQREDELIGDVEEEADDDEALNDLQYARDRLAKLAEPFSMVADGIVYSVTQVLQT